jgi:hypothetical protein
MFSRRIDKRLDSLDWIRHEYVLHLWRHRMVYYNTHIIARYYIIKLPLIEPAMIKLNASENIEVFYEYFNEFKLSRTNMETSILTMRKVDGAEALSFQKHVNNVYLDGIKLEDILNNHIGHTIVLDK